MLAMILTEAGMQPSFLVGGDVNDVGTGAHWTGRDLLVVEADESDGTFLELPLDGTIVTNVEVDHLDHFGRPEAIVAAFDEYLAGVTGPKVVLPRRPPRRPTGPRPTTPPPTAPPPAPTTAPSTSGPTTAP
jgi:UDP-N-acetylmuramate--alanine ligase